MPRPVSWSQLKLGIASVVAIIVAVLSILLFARVGALRGDTAALYVVVQEAPGVIPGTDVWLAGKKVGLVKEIRFRPVAVDTLARLAIETEILASAMPLIRRNANADIRPAGNLIGSPVVYIAAGTSAAPGIRPGDTLIGRPTETFDKIGQQLRALEQELTDLVASARDLEARSTSPSGTIGAFRAGGTARMKSVSATASRLAHQATSGSGSIGLAVQGRVRDRFDAISAQVDTVRRLLASGDGNVGRFRKDETLGPTMERIRAELDSLQDLVQNPASAMARAQSDSSLIIELRRVRIGLDSLVADMKKHPLRYISF